MTFFKRVADRDVDAAHNAICDAERAYECSYTPADRAVALDDLRRRSGRWLRLLRRGHPPTVGPLGRLQ